MRGMRAAAGFRCFEDVTMVGLGPGEVIENEITCFLVLITGLKYFPTPYVEVVRFINL